MAWFMLVKLLILYFWRLLKLNFGDNGPVFHLLLVGLNNLMNTKFNPCQC